ncbi:MAG: hypothetical protein H0X41_04215 [Chitinophagaceae bacterium]|nr:hypothetical protein [Chitinophagaceae bacterium]
MRRFLAIIIVGAILILTGVFYYRYFWLFGEGVKAGQLNYVVKKGYVFKTYEGKLIQSGFRSQTAGTIQSYEFEFSISDKNIADKLMLSSGKEVELHYKEYLHALSWRGYSPFIVDSIIAIHDPASR